MKPDLKLLDQRLSELYEKSGFPGVAVTLRGPEGLYYTRGFGVRHVDPDEPVDGDTIFVIASMGKGVTAFCLCLLQAEGKCSIDDPVTKYIPQFRIPGAPPQTVTLRHLCMHTSGLPPIQPLEWSITMNSIERESEYTQKIREQSPNKMNTLEQIMDYIAAGDYGHPAYKILGAPGEYMSYSNEGYAVLSSVVDVVAGMPLEQFLAERVFKPLGMTRSLLDEDASEARKIAGGNITSLCERDDDGKLIWDDNYSVLPPYRGCACIKSTTNDMSRFYQMLADRGMFEGKQVFPAEAVDALIGLEFPLSERPFYCLGLRKRLIGKLAVSEHYGGLHGASTGGACLEGGYGLSIFCNLGDVDVDSFMWAAYNLIADLPIETTHFRAYPNGEQFAEPEALTGKYLIEEGLPDYLDICVKDGVLTAVISDDEYPLHYCGGTMFAYYSSELPGFIANTLEFHIRDGKAWGVCRGERFLIRIE